MKLKDIMTTNAECREPSAPIAEIAGKMRDYNVGSIPVCENGKLTGIVSDRDIVIRCVAENETDAVRSGYHEHTDGDRAPGYVC